MSVADAGVRPPAERTRAPWHLWLVGILALLWNAMGAFDYLATQMRWEPYMSQFSESELAYFYGIPGWAVAAWALAVWGGLLASIGLLLRHRWAVPVFGLSLAGLAASTLHTFGLSEGAEVMGTTGAVFTAAIWAIAVLLLLYARAQAKKGVLR